MKTRTILTALGISALLVGTAHASQEQLATGIKEALAEATSTAGQLNGTLAALEALTEQTKGDLRPAYENYCSQVTNTQSAAALTQTRIKWMASDGRTYFEDWQSTVESIANESLRKKAQKRLDTVKKNYGEVESSLQKAGAEFKPFLADLTDIQKTLAVDVTAGGVKAVDSTVSDAKSHLRSLNKTIKSALKEMQEMAEMLSPEAK
jgi:hypothetical protein